MPNAVAERQPFESCAIRKGAQGDIVDFIQANFLHVGCANASSECGLKGFRQAEPFALSASELNTFQLQSRQDSDYLFLKRPLIVVLREINTEAAEIV